MKYLKLTLAAAALVLSTSVNAAIVSVDWQSTGDNLVTRDTTNGLEWLDLTETTNMSYFTVLGQLSTGSQFEGWRYATNVEVGSLFTAFGLPLDANLTVAGLVDSAIVDFSNTMGNIMDPAVFSYGARGYIGEGSGGNQYIAGAYYGISSGINFYTGPNLGSGATLTPPTTASANLGSYLVRDASVVPVPAAVWLFGSGLIGLAGIARRKKA